MKKKSNGFPENTNDKLGFTFHRSFPLNRRAINEILNIIVDRPILESEKEQISLKEIRSKSQLGTIYVDSMPRWAFGTGLIGQNKLLLSFGNYAFKNDPLLELLDTQWLMHYFISTSNGPGPLFWHELIKTHFRSGNEFSIHDLTEQIRDIYFKTEGKDLSYRSARTTATVFIGTYTKSESFGKLGIIECFDENHYRVLHPDPPSAWGIGFALLDYWKRNYSELATIKLESLFVDGGFANLFLLGTGHLNIFLRELQSIGYLEVYRVVPPYQIILLQKDSEQLFERIYGQKTSY